MTDNNIRVVCRFRPQDKKEIENRGHISVEILQDQVVHIQVVFLERSQAIIQALLDLTRYSIGMLLN